MKKALAVSNILSWVNLIISGGIVLCILITFFMYPALPVLLSVILIGSITLHSYASLQLRKSILYPTIPLSKQTPTGIRLMGYISLFFAVMSFTNGIYMLQETKDLLSQMQIPDQLKKMNFTAIIRAFGVFFMVFSLSVALNVILNIRLLKGYLMMQLEKKNAEEEA
ncbi:MAG: hypothetical protein JST87_02770 [Bacteroidetes bacterium]|nr:hypothetical protein [Bacteroidota bacterium]MBS1933581.1 hypothetical protein [Bacteroidota bacterium]